MLAAGEAEQPKQALVSEDHTATQQNVRKCLRGINMI